MEKRITSALSLAAVILLTQASTIASAHHSFPVHFVAEGEVTVTGVVNSFRFSNPHGVLEFTVVNDGEVEAWRAETNSPSILRRRGWDKDSLKAGDEVIVTGWPARNEDH